MKKINKKFAKIVLFIIAVLIIANEALAIGISPAQRYVDYTSGGSETNKIRIFNEGKNDITIILHTQGEIADYIVLETEEIHMKEGQAQAEISYTINMPTGLEKPGVHEGYIIAFEVPAGKDINEIGIGAVLAVSSAVKLRVPYPEEYAEAEMYIESAAQDGEVNFLIPVFNYGTKDIDAYAKIEIYGATYEKIAEINTESISLNPRQDGQIATSWKADVNQGVYKAVATVYYGERSIRIEKNFDVGSVYIKILGIKADDFVLGGIAKFNIYLENVWGESIEHVYADVIFKDKAGNEYGRFKTSEIGMNKYETGTLEAYWDTRGVSAGDYYMDLTVNYAGHTTKEIIETFVNLDSITTNKIIGNVIKNKGDANMNTIILTGLAVMIGLNVLWLVYFKKRNKK